MLVVPPDHHFAGRQDVTVADAAAERIILFDQRSSYHELTEALFRAARVRPRAVMELDSSGAAARMVERGLGVALLPLSAAAQAIAQGTLARGAAGRRRARAAADHRHPPRRRAAAAAGPRAAGDDAGVTSGVGRRLLELQRRVREAARHRAAVDRQARCR